MESITELNRIYQRSCCELRGFAIEFLFSSRGSTKWAFLVKADIQYDDIVSLDPFDPRAHVRSSGCGSFLSNDRHRVICRVQHALNSDGFRSMGLCQEAGKDRCSTKDFFGCQQCGIICVFDPDFDVKSSFFFLSVFEMGEQLAWEMKLVGVIKNFSAT